MCIIINKTLKQNIFNEKTTVDENNEWHVVPQTLQQRERQDRRQQRAVKLQHPHWSFSSQPSGPGQAARVSTDQQRPLCRILWGWNRASGRFRSCVFNPPVNPPGRTERCLRRASLTWTAPSATARTQPRTEELRRPTRTVRRPGWGG